MCSIRSATEGPGPRRFYRRILVIAAIAGPWPRRPVASIAAASRAAPTRQGLRAILERLESGDRRYLGPVAACSRGRRNAFTEWQRATRACEESTDELVGGSSSWRAWSRCRRGPSRWGEGKKRNRHAENGAPYAGNYHPAELRSGETVRGVRLRGPGHGPRSALAVRGNRGNVGGQDRSGPRHGRDSLHVARL